MSSSIEKYRSVVANGIFGIVPDLLPENRNFVYSPMSIGLLASMIGRGCSIKALAEILKVLKVESLDELQESYSKLIELFEEDQAEVGLANGIWVDHKFPLLASFKLDMEDYFRASSFPIDFINEEPSEILTIVNDWVAGKTNNLILDAIPDDSLRSDTRLIIVNSLYFEGKLSRHHFSASGTIVGTFHRLNNATSDASFMTNKEKHYVGTYDTFQVLRLPYDESEDKKCQFSLYIVLPNSINGIIDLTKRVEDDGVGFFEEHVPQNLVRVNKLRIPKFKIDYGFEASTYLKKVGITKAFQEFQLTGMVEETEDKPSKWLQIESVFHKSRVELNEDGTSAASSSISRKKIGNVRDLGVDFVADHPFIFRILEENTGTVLFYGHVLDPSEVEINDDTFAFA